MGDGFQFIDLIFFGMVAAFLVLRLRSVLGRRHGPPTGHRDPFRRPAEIGESDKSGDKVIPLPGRDAPPEAEPAVAKAAAGAEAPLEAGFAEIGIVDSKFDKGEFVSGARMAFEMILGAFATGNRPALKPMLSPEVYTNFSRVIDERDAAGHKLDQTIVAIKTAEPVEAVMDGRIAHITVKFVSEQINVVRDAQGAVVEGDPKTATVVTDFWTFARDTRSRDPNWTLIGTQSLE